LADGAPRLGCVLLAAGAGRRFGGPKQIALWRGAPLLEWALDAALGVPALHPIVVVLGAHRDEVAISVDLSPADVVYAPDWEDGQSASLRAGVAALGAVDGAVVLLADMPFVTAQVVAGVIDHHGSGCDVVRAVYEGQPGHPVLLGRAALARVPELSGDVGARALFAHLRVRDWEAGHLCDPMDIDTRTQLEAIA
jgi:molybdenum cofactor cytidylyltransferase